MSFSRAQQPEFRILVKAAWQQHVRETGAGKSQERAWYEAELLEATGKDSTSKCNAGRDYEAACAHFEALVGTSIKWQMKACRGDAKRILWHLDQITEKHGLSENYLRRIAHNSAPKHLRETELPQLADLAPDHLTLILGEVKRFVRRKKARAEEEPEPAVEPSLFPNVRSKDPDWSVA